MDNVNLTIGEKILIFRRRKGLSKRQLADILGVSPQTVSNYENGVTLPPTSSLPTIALTLGVNMDDLLFDPEAEERSSHIHTPKLTQSQLENMF